MAKIDYSSLSRDELIELIGKYDKQLKKRKCGIVWDYEKVPEQVVLDCESNAPVIHEVQDKSIVLDESEDNVLIIGENYYSLECLSFTHSGAFDVIYIDPPYNTLKDGFMYNDKMVDSEDTYRHSRWLNFMEKRLKIAHKLMSKDGIIAISIDDNEYAQLKLLCDQIFKEENLLDVFHIQVRYEDKSLNEKDHFQKIMEYVLIYAKNKKTFIPNKPFEDYSIDAFNNEIILLEKPIVETIGKRKVEIYKKGTYKIIQHSEGSYSYLKSTWATGSVVKVNASGKYFETHLKPRKEIDGIGTLYKVYGIGDDGLGYRFFTGPKKKTAKQGEFYSGIPTERLEEINSGGSSIKYKPIINYYDYAGDFGNIKDEGGVNFPGGKKPIKMLKQIINMHPNKNALILDFFAGSGSTGHAVLSLNDEDGGKRRFILATNNEVKPSLIEKFCKENNITWDDYFALLHQKNKKIEQFANENGLVNLYTYPRLKNVVCGYQTDSGTSVNGFKSNLKVYESKVISINNINTITDNDRKKITFEVGELIALKENTFVKIESNKWFEIYSDRKDNKYTAIYFRENLEEFDTLIEKIGDKLCSLYIYSSGKIDKEIFEYLPSNIIVKDIPQPILDIYAQINRNVRK